MIRTIMLLAAVAFTVAVVADMPGHTVSDTELKEQPDDGSETLLELTEGAEIILGQRKGAWYSARADEESGWLRMLSVRLSSTATRPGDSGVRSLLQVGRTDATVTTGVRGLTVEELRNARENRAALEVMAAQQPTPEEIDEFARAGALTARQVDEPEAQSRRRGRRR